MKTPLILLFFAKIIFCEEIPSCPNLNNTQICDGFANNCNNNNDESQKLCEKYSWTDLKCPIEGQIRCKGHRPGQCLETFEICDGKYDCIDRSDEDGCFYKTNQTLITSTISTTTIISSETSPQEDENGGEKKNYALLGTLAFMFLGIPLTWLIKSIFIKWLVKRHAEFDAERHQKLQQLAGNRELQVQKKVFKKQKSQFFEG